MPRKICAYCEKRKNHGSFPKHTHHKDNLDSRCKKCINKQTKIRNKLRKKAPNRPDICECCKKIPSKWALDHNHDNNSFRGWLCERCNTGIGSLGDDLYGIINALKYLSIRTVIEDMDILNGAIDGVIFVLNNLLEKRRQLEFKDINIVYANKETLAN